MGCPGKKREHERDPRYLAVRLSECQCGAHAEGERSHCGERADP